MPATDPALLPLLAHPDTPAIEVRRLVASAELAAVGLLRVRYVLEADASRIRVPSPVARPGREDHLWAHTCFEAFVGSAQSPGYLELNFSPSGQWAAYGFASHRQGMAPAALQVAPRLAVHRDAGRLELEAEVLFSGMLPDGRNVRVALSAVVEDQDGGLSYFALRHPSGRPDFHHPDGFSLALALPRSPAQT